MHVLLAAIFVAASALLQSSAQENSHCSSCSCCGAGLSGTCAQLWWCVETSSWGPQAKLLLRWGGVSQCLLHWQKGSFPPSHQGSHVPFFLIPHVWHTIWYVSFSFLFFPISICDRWFRVSCWFLLCSKVNQLHIYIYPLSQILSSHTGSYRILSRVPCATGVGPCPLSILYIVCIC